MEKKIIVINGTGGSGKDTFIEMCAKFAKILNVSTVDKVKEAARILVGWNGEKTDEARKMLSDLKALSVEYNNAPTKYITERVEEFAKSNLDLMFIHIREPEEIQKAKDLFGAETLLITNGRVKIIETNVSDRDVLNYNYDFTIENDGTLEELEEKARNFVRGLDKK